MVEDQHKLCHYTRQQFLFFLLQFGQENSQHINTFSCSNPVLSDFFLSSDLFLCSQALRTKDQSQMIGVLNLYIFHFLIGSK